MWATLTRVSCAYIYFGAVLADQLRHYRKPQHAARQWNRPRCRAILLWLGDLDDGVVSTAVYIQGCFATGGTIQGVAYGMMSFHGGYNEWHILLPCEVAQYDWYHRHMLNYAFGTGGMTMSDIAISSWCSTERQGDTSESVVFHFLLLGVWDRCLFVCVWLLCFACFVVWFPQTPCFPFHLFSNKWE